MEGRQSTPVRRRYALTQANVRKIERLRRRYGVSAGEIVRRAIDAYDPDAEELAADAVLEYMGAALRAACEDLAHQRAARVTEADHFVAQADERARVRAYFIAHPAELDALRRCLVP